MGDAPRRTESGEHQLVKDAERAAEVRERLAELTDDNWVTRQAAARALGELGEPAALAPLRQALANDGDYDVREAVVIAIAALEQDEDALREDLLTAIRDPHPYVWRRAVTVLEQRFSTETARAALETRIRAESDPNAIVDLGQTLLEVGGDTGLTDQTLELLGSSVVDDIAKGALLVRMAKPAAADQQTRLVEGLTEALPRIDPTVVPNVFVIDEAFRRVIELTGSAVAIELLLADPRLPGRLALLPDRDLMEARIEPLGPDERRRLADGVQQAIATDGSGLSLLAVLIGDDAAVDFLVDEIPPEAEAGPVAALMDARKLVESAWAARSAELLPVVLRASANQDWRVRQSLAQFLGAVAEKTPSDKLGRVEEVLEELTRDPDVDVRQTASTALIDVRSQSRRTATGPLIAKLNDNTLGEQEVQEAITNLLEMGQPDSVRPVVQTWTRWIGLHDRSGLVEFTAEKLRSSPKAVIPLLDQLDQGLQLDEELERRLRHDAVPREYAHLAELIAEGATLTKQVDKALAAEWFASRSGQKGPSTDADMSEAAKGVSMLIAALVEEVRLARELTVRQRVSRELAEMSDERFFDEPETFAPIRSELVKHAIPILGRRLDSEDDSTIRENIARVLGNVGGREAVDVLARAVVGEERKRSNRQELLAEYYLKPSKERSDQAATILHDAVDEAKRTLRLLRRLNVVFFCVGLLILLGGFVLIATGDTQTAQLLGGALGLGGFAALALQLVREPLVRIQNAVTRLVQVETAFASFIWELNLNGTYIQSQYVAEGILSDDEIAATVDRIERAMHLSMDLVARYAEEGRAPVGPRLSSLSPQAGAPGSTLTAYGAGLKSVGRNGSALIAVNHVPIAAGSLEWSDSVVSFTLPDVLGEKIKPGEALWISLLVDGHETNAVPFRLVGAARNGG
jgi:HEAT repeat protein